MPAPACGGRMGPMFTMASAVTELISTENKGAASEPAAPREERLFHPGRALHTPCSMNYKSRDLGSGSRAQQVWSAHAASTHACTFCMPARLKHTFSYPRDRQWGLRSGQRLGGVCVSRSLWERGGVCTEFAGGLRPDHMKGANPLPPVFISAPGSMGFLLELRIKKPFPRSAVAGGQTWVPSQRFMWRPLGPLPAQAREVFPKQRCSRRCRGQPRILLNVALA